MLIGHATARRQSVAQGGLEIAAAAVRPRFPRSCGPGETLRRQVVAGLTGLLGFLALVLALTGFRTVAGLMLVGLPAGTSETSLGAGSGPKKARQPGDRRDLLRIMQTVTRSTSGISAPQN